LIILDRTLLEYKIGKIHDLSQTPKNSPSTNNTNMKREESDSSTEDEKSDNERPSPAEEKLRHWLESTSGSEPSQFLEFAKTNEEILQRGLDLLRKWAEELPDDQQYEDDNSLGIEEAERAIKYLLNLLATKSRGRTSN
jgi:hypothetical protein